RSNPSARAAALSASIAVAFATSHALSRTPVVRILRTINTLLPPRRTPSRLVLEGSGRTWPTAPRMAFLSFGNERRWAGYRGLAGIHRRGLGPVSCCGLVV